MESQTDGQTVQWILERVTKWDNVSWQWLEAQNSLIPQNLFHTESRSAIYPAGSWASQNFTQADLNLALSHHQSQKQAILAT